MLVARPDHVRNSDAQAGAQAGPGQPGVDRVHGERRRKRRWIDRYLPGSLTGILGLALTVTTIPLLLGTIAAAVQMRDLALASERLVLNGVLATRHTQAIVRQVAAMERAARLYQILQRPSLLAAVSQVRSSLDGVLHELATLPGDATREQLITNLQQTADRAVDETSASGGTRREALRAFSEMARTAGELSRLAADQTQHELAKLRTETERVRRWLYWQAGALVPVTVGLILLFTRLIGRPLRAMDAAIADIGHGRLAEPVTIRGPSDLQALGRQLEWLRRRLLEIADERNRFLRHMSHELKTPLANIREGSELLTEGAVGALAPEQREVAGIMRENSLRLQRLIENLLSYSEWQARRGALELSEFELRPLVDATLEQYLLPLNTRRIRLDLEVPAGLALRADRPKLRLVVDNLLSNAVKFTPDGGTITLRAAAKDGWLELEVADTGPGIAPEDRSRIFEAFYQGATPAGSLVRGTGIGLSVVEEFVRAQGGSVDLVDGEFPGAHFRVRLPMVVPAEGAATGVELTPP
jgi:two-component system sensor histidine kinase GlrK